MQTSSVLATRIRAAAMLLWRHRVALLALFCGVLAPLILLEDLVDAARLAHPLPLDVQILHAIHAHASPRKDWVIVGATRAAYWLTLPFVIFVIAGLRALKQPAGAAFFAVAVGGAWLLNISAKLFFGRVRPTLWESLLPEKTFSFPSGHAMMSTALALALVILAWPTRLRWPALIGALPAVLLIGLSRLYLGVHYPTDILGGWCAGLIWATGAYFICKPHRFANDAVRS